MALPAGLEHLRLAATDVVDRLRAEEQPVLPRYLTKDERQTLLQLEALRAREPQAVPPRVAAPPPALGLRTPAEYEQNQAIIMRWSSGQQTSLLTQMIVPITTGDSLARVLLVVSGSSQRSNATSTLTAAGANMSRVQFVTAATDSVWIRDYGPRFSEHNTARVEIDHRYNRPRPNDDRVPIAIAGALGESRYDLPLTHGGGNFHQFANGDAFMTQLIVNENPGQSSANIVNTFRTYEGVNLTILQAFPSSYDATQHLDMWFLPVDDHTVIIGQYPQSDGGGVPFQVTESTATLMRNRGYTVLRTPGWRSGGVHFTYTNAVIVNNVVLTCEFGGSNGARDAQAHTTFQAAFPGKAIVPLNCGGIIGLAGALHCIVMHMPTFTPPVASRQREPSEDAASFLRFPAPVAR